MNPITTKTVSKMITGVLFSLLMLHGIPGETRSQEPAKPMIQDYVNAAIAPVPESLKLDPFYKKYTDALGIPIVGSDMVPNADLICVKRWLSAKCVSA